MKKTKSPSPADILAETARVIYDTHDVTPHWRLPVARGLGIDDDTVRRWMSGRTALPANHPALPRLLELTRRREHEIHVAGDKLEAWLRKHGGTS